MKIFTAGLILFLSINSAGRAEEPGESPTCIKFAAEREKSYGDPHDPFPTNEKALSAIAFLMAHPHDLQESCNLIFSMVAVRSLHGHFKKDPDRAKDLASLTRLATDYRPQTANLVNFLVRTEILRSYLASNYTGENRAILSKRVEDLEAEGEKLRGKIFRFTDRELGQRTMLDLEIDAVKPLGAKLDGLIQQVFAP